MSPLVAGLALPVVEGQAAELSRLYRELGDIFWDLAPYIPYLPGSELGCTIYVANPSEEAREYSLIARLSSDTQVISEEAVRVFGHAWFEVGPGEWLRLHGAFLFEEANVWLRVLLVEKESGEAVDSVSSYLAAPAAAAWPPGWPGAPAPTDWSSLMGMLLPVMMLGVMGVVMTRAVKAPAEERKLLPPGR